MVSSNSKSKTNVSDTSIECFHQITREGQIQREAELVIQIISENQPITSRTLSFLSKKERGNITRSLFDLTEKELIKTPYTAKCPITNKRVRYYALMNWIDPATVNVECPNLFNQY